MADVPSGPSLDSTPHYANWKKKLISRQVGISKLDAIHLNWIHLYNHFALTTQKTEPLYCWEGMFTAPLHSNGSYSIVPCVFVAAKICLPCRCLAMNVYSDFTIPTFGRRVTILKHLFIIFNIIMPIKSTRMRGAVYTATKWKVRTV
jgi:hypothetical protein